MEAEKLEFGHIDVRPYLGGNGTIITDADERLYIDMSDMHEVRKLGDRTLFTINSPFAAKPRAGGKVVFQRRSPDSKVVERWGVAPREQMSKTIISARLLKNKNRRPL